MGGAWEDGRKIEAGFGVRGDRACGVLPLRNIRIEEHRFVRRICSEKPRRESSRRGHPT